MERVFFSLGSLLAALAVAAGAYAAHGGVLTAEQADWIAKAARYQMYHSLALLAVVWAGSHWPQQARLLQVAGWLFLAGMLLFCGSLYLLALGGIHSGYVTPAGGMAFILGWLIMSVAVWCKRA